MSLLMTLEAFILRFFLYPVTINSTKLLFRAILGIVSTLLANKANFFFLVSLTRRVLVMLSLFTLEVSVDI